MHADEAAKGDSPAPEGGSLNRLMSELHQLPEDHPAVLRAVVVERLKGNVGVAEVRASIADLEMLLRRLVPPTPE